MKKLYYDSIDYILEEKYVKAPVENYTEKENAAKDNQETRTEDELFNAEAVKNEKKKVDYREGEVKPKEQEYTAEFIGDDKTPETEEKQNFYPDQSDKEVDKGNIDKVKKLNKPAMTDLYINFSTDGDE